MKTIGRVLLIWCMLVLPLTAQAAGSLHIATEGAYPPFNYLDENGRLAGFDVEIALALCREMDVRCTMVALPWDDLLPSLAKGKCDAVVASMARTPEREQMADFTNFYYRSRTGFVGIPGTAFAQTTQSMAALRLGAQAGTVQQEYLKTTYPDATILTAPTAEDTFGMLVRGEVDTVLCDSLSGFEFLQSPAGTPFDFIGTPLPALHFSNEACIAVGKGNTKLADAFNKAISAIQLNGVYGKINRKYFPFSIY